MNLVEFLIANRKRFENEFKELPEQRPTETWFNSSVNNWPELSEFTTNWKTFYQTYRMNKPALLALAQADREIDRLATQLATQLDAQNLDTQNATQDKPTDKPPVIDGWRIQLSPDGYYRAHKRIGKMWSVYIGKTLDLDKARAKIQARESRIKQG